MKGWIEYVGLWIVLGALLLIGILSLFEKREELPTAREIHRAEQKYLKSIEDPNERLLMEYELERFHREQAEGHRDIRK